MSLELLGTFGCHLCEQAEVLVYEALANNDNEGLLTVIDIADDSTLMDEFGVRIPVLRRGGRLLVWPFSAVEIADFLLATSAKPSRQLTPENRS